MLRLATAFCIHCNKATVDLEDQLMICSSQLVTNTKTRVAVVS